jgi:hypothetical protein
MPPDPKKFVANALSLFGTDTIVVLVTRAKDGGFEANGDSLMEATPREMLAAFVTAQSTLNRQIAAMLQAVAEQTGKPVEEVYEYFKHLVDEHAEQTRATYETSSVTERKVAPAAGLLDATGRPIEHKPRLKISE